MTVRRMLQAEGVTEGTMRTVARPDISYTTRSYRNDRSMVRSSDSGVSHGIPLAVLIKSLAVHENGGADFSATDCGASTTSNDVQNPGWDACGGTRDDTATREMARVAATRGWGAVPLFPSDRPL